MQHRAKRSVKVPGTGLTAIDCKCGWRGRGQLSDGAKEEYDRHAAGEIMEWEEEWNKQVVEWQKKAGG